MGMREVIRDDAGRMRLAGPRANSIHPEVYDVWPEPVLALAWCICLRCGKVWREGDVGRPLRCVEELPQEPTWGEQIHHGNIELQRRGPATLAEALGYSR